MKKLAIPLLLSFILSFYLINNNIIKKDKNSINYMENIEKSLYKDKKLPENYIISIGNKKIKDKKIKKHNNQQIKDSINKAALPKIESEKVLVKSKIESRYNAGTLSGYLPSNVRSELVAGDDFKPGIYWTGTFNDSCESARLIKKSGDTQYGTYGGEQIIYNIEKGDILISKCNWYNTNLPKFLDKTPTGIILAEQIGVGGYIINNRGSCFFTIENFGKYSKEKVEFLPNLPLDYIITITELDIINQKTINLDISCGGLTKVSNKS
jgi:hypothetical protein